MIILFLAAKKFQMYTPVTFILLLKAPPNVPSMNVLSWINGPYQTKSFCLGRVQMHDIMIYHMTAFSVSFLPLLNLVWLFFLLFLPVSFGRYNSGKSPRMRALKYWLLSANWHLLSTTFWLECIGFFFFSEGRFVFQAWTSEGCCFSER
jgi:hypothetical protein